MDAKYHKAINGFKDGRGLFTRKYFGSDVIPRLEATKLFQRVWRGQRDRRLKVAPERLKLKNAWNWLNPILPPEAFEQFMPRSTYDIPGGHKPATFQTPYLVGQQTQLNWLSTLVCAKTVDGVDVHKPKSGKNTNYSMLTKDQLKVKKHES